jgi:paraquat-inducible protein B
MSKQANKKAIGAFVLAALALGVAAIIIFGSGKFFVKTSEYVAYFQGSVKGLSVGAPVVFRGVKVGQVTKITIYADPSNQTFEIQVLMEINPDDFKEIGPVVENRKQLVHDLIQKGLRAQLQMQSMVTGQLMINIDFYPGTPAKLISTQNIELPKGVTEIPTIQTPLQKIEKTLEELPIGEIATSINASLKGIEKIVTSDQLTKSLSYFEQSMGDFRQVAQHLDEKIQLLSADLSQTLKDAQSLLGNLNTQVEPLALSLKRASNTTGDTMADVGRLTENVNIQVKTLAGDFAKTLQTAQDTLASVNGAVGEGSPLRIQIESAVTEFGQAARAIRVLADYLQRNPDALLRGKPQKGGF